MKEEAQKSELRYIPSDVMKQIVDHLAGSQATLHALVSVCRMTRPIAESLLYRNIRITSRQYDASRTERLSTTIWNAPALSALVRTFKCNVFSQEIVSLSIDIVMLCENLEDIESFTYAADWTEILPHKPHLKRLKLRRGGIMLAQGSQQYSIPKLLLALTHCPALESIEICRATGGSYNRRLVESSQG